MSEMEKKDLPQEDAVNTAAESETPPAQEAAAAEASDEKAAAKEAKAEDTFTVTREQMEQMEQLAKTVSESGDKYLRLAAEYDNYRKRTAKEKESTYDNAKADTIKPFLDVYDNLLRGLEQFDPADPHRQGMELICKQLVDVLAKLGVEEIPAENQPFDPERHNAVMHVDDENAGENTVVEVFQKGFIMGEKVLRFSMVKVAN